jgi:hypothetical protein
MKRIYTTFVLFLLSLAIMAQGVVTGTILDETDEPLVGASIFIKGTTKGTITDLDGKFSIEHSVEKAFTLEISYLGYSKRSIKITNASTDLGVIVLEFDSQSLAEVTVTGTMDIVRDRRTPVAVSTISTADIQAKGGNVEFPELMKNTPSIYVAGQAGGYGDSEVFTRGFDQTNTAFLLNGQPINGMEDGKMYWSNWSGMTDVANAVQIQRGLGSSKLAISSVGGTVNIIMKPTELNKGGSVSFQLGNDSYIKTTASYNTGLINDKFGVSVLLTHWQGNGWAEGTEGAGQNYFISAGWRPADNHSVNFLITGAPQWHHQNFNSRISDHFDDSGEFNIKHNGNWGLLDGEVYSSRRNYYHKPVMNLNWEWATSEKSSLSTVLYGSFGRGGGSGGLGQSSNRFFTSDGQWDFDAIVAANKADNGSAEYVMRNSVNNHSWFGLVTTFDTEITKNLTASIGTDLRSYRGSHFREIRDLLGAPSYTQSSNARFGEREITAEYAADPWSGLTSFADLNERVVYNNDETIRYGGLFGQVEYSKDAITVFGQGAISNQSHVRYELFNQTEANEVSENIQNFGYNLKTGLSYLINAKNSIFVNTGYYQRQPFHDNIYLNNSNTVNPVTVPEKIFGLEAGYKYQTRDLRANVNIYRTSWKDRTTTQSLDEGDELPNGIVLTDEGYRNTVQNQLHSGIEVDFAYEINSMFRLKGFGSLGTWEFEGTLTSDFFDVDRNLLYSEAGVDVNGVKVGGSAQTTFGLGLDYKVTKKLRFDVDYNYYNNLYSNIGVGSTALELPSFGLFDLGASYNHELSNGNLLSFRANVFNALGKEYISRATSSTEASENESDNWNGINKRNFVTFGKTRTWNVSVRYSFF